MVFFIVICLAATSFDFGFDKYIMCGPGLRLIFIDNSPFEFVLLDFIVLSIWYLILVFFMFVRINKPTYLLTMLIVSYFAWILDPLFDVIGYNVLTYKPLENLFGFLVDVPFVGFTKFNNTIVMGSFLFCLVLYVPFFLAGIAFVKFWRAKVAPAFIRSPLYKAAANLPVIGKIFEAFEEKF